MTSQQNHVEDARCIIDTNMYMVLATANKAGKPLATPVFYAYDGNNFFYFMSAAISEHAKNIMESCEASICIFDSSQPMGHALHVQAYCKASALSMETDIKSAIETYCTKLFPKSATPATERYNPSEYVEGSEFRFFRLSIIHAYTDGTDGKLEVRLGRS